MPDEASYLADGALPDWKGRAIALVDLDAFFASVEQLDHPEWRGKPVIVGGEAGKRGVVATASYEARKFGVHSAMASAIAMRLCPDAIWVRGNRARYSEMSKEVMEILLAESPLLQQVSIDEAFLDISPGRYSGDHPVAIAQRIRRRVAKLGITCSVGLGTSMSVAKIASEMDKPNGITVVFPGSESSFLSPLPASSLSGIGRKTDARLHDLGINTLGDLAKADPGILRPILGINTNEMQRRAAGTSEEAIEVEREVKSVSNEMTFSTDLVDYSDIRAAVEMMAEKVGRRLRREGHAGHVIALKMRYDDLSRRTAQKRIDASTDDEHVFTPVLIDLIGELWQPGVRVRLVGVEVAGLDEPSEQLSLFGGAQLDGSTAAGSQASYAGADALSRNGASASLGKSGGGAHGKSGGGAHGKSGGDAHGKSGDASHGRAGDAEARRRLVEATDKVKDRFGDNAVSFGRDLRFKDKGTGTVSKE